MNRRTFLFRLAALSAAPVIARALPAAAAPFAEPIADPLIEGAAQLANVERWPLYVSGEWTGGTPFEWVSWIPVHTRRLSSTIVGIAGMDDAIFIHDDPRSGKLTRLEIGLPAGLAWAMPNGRMLLRSPLDYGGVLFACGITTRIRFNGAGILTYDEADLLGIGREAARS